MPSMKDKLQQIEKDREKLKSGGGKDEIEKVHGAGKFTARERIEKLLDKGTFQEIDLWSEAYRTGFPRDEMDIPGDGVVAGWGEVNGRPLYMWAQDSTVLGGSMAEVHIRKIVLAMEKALRERVPIVGLYDSIGMREESALTAHGYFTPTTMMNYQALLSGVIPQISLVMGPCLGAAALSASLADFVFMVKDTSYLRVASMSASQPTDEQDNARMHSRQSGCCDVLSKNDEEALALCRELLSYLPQNNIASVSPATPAEPLVSKEELMEMVPVEPSKWFDMRRVIRAVVDRGDYFELKRDFAMNLTTGFARVAGQTVGIIGNNSIWRGGCHDVDASDKHARFTRFCDAFNIPLIYFADSPAFYPSVEEERKGILRHGTKVIHSTAEATVPKLTLYIRKCYGGGQIAMPGNWMLADRSVAWPSVERGLMGPEELVSILWRKPIQEAKTPEEQKLTREKGIKIMGKAIERFTRTSSEDFIDPRETRSFLIQALKCLVQKKHERPWRKHENINL